MYTRRCCGPVPAPQEVERRGKVILVYGRCRSMVQRLLLLLTARGPLLYVTDEISNVPELSTEEVRIAVVDDLDHVPRILAESSATQVLIYVPRLLPPPPPPTSETPEQYYRWRWRLREYLYLLEKVRAVSRARGLTTYVLVPARVNPYTGEYYPYLGRYVTNLVDEVVPEERLEVILLGTER